MPQEAFLHHVFCCRLDHRVFVAVTVDACRPARVVVVGAAASAGEALAGTLHSAHSTSNETLAEETAAQHGHHVNVGVAVLAEALGGLACGTKCHQEYRTVSLWFPFFQDIV